MNTAGLTLAPHQKVSNRCKAEVDLDDDVAATSVQEPTLASYPDQYIPRYFADWARWAPAWPTVLFTGSDAESSSSGGEWHPPIETRGVDDDSMHAAHDQTRPASRSGRPTGLGVNTPAGSTLMRGQVRYTPDKMWVSARDIACDALSIWGTAERLAERAIHAVSRRYPQFMHTRPISRSGRHALAVGAGQVATLCSYLAEVLSPHHAAAALDYPKTQHYAAVVAEMKGASVAAAAVAVVAPSIHNHAAATTAAQSAGALATPFGGSTQGTLAAHSPLATRDDDNLDGLSDIDAEQGCESPADTDVIGTPSHYLLHQGASTLSTFELTVLDAIGDDHASSLAARRERLGFPPGRHELPQSHVGDASDADDDDDDDDDSSTDNSDDATNSDSSDSNNSDSDNTDAESELVDCARYRRAGRGDISRSSKRRRGCRCHHRASRPLPNAKRQKRLALASVDAARVAVDVGGRSRQQHMISPDSDDCSGAMQGVHADSLATLLPALQTDVVCTDGRQLVLEREAHDALVVARIASRSAPSRPIHLWRWAGRRWRLALEVIPSRQNTLWPWQILYESAPDNEDARAPPPQSRTDSTAWIEWKDLAALLARCLVSPHWMAVASATRRVPLVEALVDAAESSPLALSRWNDDYDPLDESICAEDVLTVADGWVPAMCRRWIKASSMTVGTVGSNAASAAAVGVDLSRQIKSLADDVKDTPCAGRLRRIAADMEAAVTASDICTDL